jgi:sugar lactone lactonase YvrE
MFSRCRRWLFIIVGAATLAACSTRWEPPTILQSGSAPSESPTISNVLYVANASSNEIAVYQSGGDQPYRKITEGIANPFALAKDGEGNLFVANGGSGARGWVSVYAPGATEPTRKITSGITKDFSIAVAPSGELFIRDSASAEIYEYARRSQTIERKITQGIVSPTAISVDAAGYLYVSNCQECLQPVLHDTLTIYAPKSAKLYRTIVTSYNGPGQVAFDKHGNAYVDSNGSIDVYAGHGAKRIRRIRGAQGALTFDASGNLYSGQLRYLNSGGRVLVYAPGTASPSYIIKKGIVDPQALAVDPAGVLYVANTAHNDVAVYAPGSANPSRTITVATGLSAPEALAFDSSGNLYAANSWGSTVTVYGSENNAVLRTITHGIVTPMALAFDRDGNLYVANYEGTPGGVNTDNGAVTVYAPGAARPFLTIAEGIHGWNYSMGFDSAKNLYVASGCYNHNNPISVYAHGSASLLRTISKGVYYPCAITLDAPGNLYVANYGANSVAIFPSGGSTPSRIITNGLNYPDALALDESGKLFVTNWSGGHDRRWGSITVYPPEGVRPSRKITQGLDSGAGPYGSVLGPSGDLYVVDSATRILVYPNHGRQPSRRIERGLAAPSSLAFDRAGNLYVANLDSSTVTEYAVGTDRLIRTIPAVKGHPVALLFASR